MGKAARLVNQSNVVDAKGETDTIRLWENYREQATMWRAIALLQIPATLIALIFAMFIYSNRKQIINVPEKPLPGYYGVAQVPEDEFVNISTEYINLVATYTSENARKQFKKAAEMVDASLLEVFREAMFDQELKIIESSNRTQVFFADPSLTLVRKTKPQEVTVWLLGDRTKLIAGSQVGTTGTVYKIAMKTLPRNKLNPYGIMITNVESIPEVKGGLRAWHDRFLRDERKAKKKGQRRRG